MFFKDPGPRPNLCIADSRTHLHTRWGLSRTLGLDGLAAMASPIAAAASGMGVAWYFGTMAASLVWLVGSPIGTRLSAAELVRARAW